MRAASSLWRHLGWRGLTMAGVGACWVVVGLGLILTVRPAVNDAVGPLIRIMPLEAWGGVWIASGILGLVGGVMRPGRDMWGFAAIVLMPAYWALSYLFAAVSGEYSPGWVTVPVYGAVILLVAVIAVLTGRRKHACICERGGSR